MRIFKKTNVETLSEWLEVATKKLEQTAKERIHKEIEAHYAEAVECRTRDGFSEDQARTMALLDLGDARAAARQFRNRYLTVREFESLKQQEKIARSPRWLLFNYVAFFLIVLIPFPGRITEHRFPWLYTILQLLILFVLPTTRFILTKPGRKFSRHLVLTQSGISFLWGMFLDHFFRRDYSWDLSDIFLCIGLSMYLLGSIRLWNKLGTVDALHGDNSSPKAVQP